MASTAMSRLGMSSFVFVVYTNALSSVILLPFSYFYHRKDKIHAPLFTFPILSRVFLLGLLGVTIAQNLAFAGLSYSSPIVACGMANMIPALTFILAIFLRKISIDVKSQGSQARMIGTVISIIGGMSMTYYKGPVVKQYSPLFLQLARPRLLVFTSTHENWVLGCFLFVTASLALCAWNIIQAGTIRKYPQLALVAVYFLLILFTMEGNMLSAIICGMGYYTTLWGQLNEDEQTSKKIKGSMLPTTSDEKVPLLQEREEEEEQGDSKV
ncbi:putative WAT1-related protein-like [Capsicum annuum]|nr:putative WAT1-related protein-like [Capsicum annuum]